LAPDFAAVCFVELFFEVGIIIFLSRNWAKRKVIDRRRPRSRPQLGRCAVNRPMRVQRRRR
jgi:hypothetical protein